MSASPGLSTAVSTGRPYFRITSPSFPNHLKVVDGRGAFKSAAGARYNHSCTTTVYLTEEIETCLAEKMFYFHRETLRLLDLLHLMKSGGLVPPFKKRFILWEIYFAGPVPDVFDMNIPGAAGYFNIFPCMTLNPSQDYEHLKDKRTVIQTHGYQGLRVGSSRALNGGNLVVLFHDQSSNVHVITPHVAELRLVTDQGTPFSNHAHEILDFSSGEVRIVSGSLPGFPHQQWKRVDFRH
jgi:hypothetical protein